MGEGDLPLERFVARRKIGQAVEVFTCEVVAGFNVEALADVCGSCAPAIAVRSAPVVFADDRTRSERSVEIRGLAVRRGCRVENLTDEQVDVRSEGRMIGEPGRVESAGLAPLGDLLLNVIGDVRQGVADGMDRKVPEVVARRPGAGAGG